MTTNLVPQILSGQDPYPAVVRTGIVTGSTATRVSAEVGGTLLSAAYLDSYEPLAGDLVALIRQDFTWLVLGRYAGSGTNRVRNPSFEESEPGAGNPALWFTAGFGGGSPAAVSVVTTPDAVSGSQVLQHGPAVAAHETLSYSTPFGITPGATYALSVYAMAIGQPAGVQAVDARLYGVWFSEGETSYPSPTQPVTESLAAQRIDMPNGPPFMKISGTVVAPDDAEEMSIGLRSSLAILHGVQWDLAIAREAPNA